MTVAEFKLENSRKIKGAAENNRCEVRELVDKADILGNGIYIITDKDDNRVYVDTKRGLTAAMLPVRDYDGRLSIDYKWYCDGATSSKSNGYVYTPLVIANKKGKLVSTIYATHSIIAMLVYRHEYDKLELSDITPICNHKNNRPWDNSASNLEWVTQGENIRHGKIVNSLYAYYGDKYVHIENNLSNTDFRVLDQELSIKDINRYLELSGNKDAFKCGAKEYIDERELLKFVNWLESCKIWTRDLVY